MIGATSVESINADASLNALLSGMLVGAGAPAGYTTQMGSTYSGGYANISIPNQQYNVISFAPPNLSMGCGGINLFMGSFSFINGKQLVQLLTQIGQGLASYAFYEAIHTMCPSCASILSALQSAAESMNNALRNTCQAGHGFSIANFAQNMGQSAKSFSTALGAMAGTASDFGGAISLNQLNPGSWLSSLAGKTVNAVSTGWSTGWNAGYNSVKGQPHTVAKTGTPTTTPLQNFIPHIGNFTWRTLLHSQAATTLSGITPSNGTAMEMLMSMLGTTVITPQAQAAAKNEAAAQGSAGGKGSTTKYQGGASPTGVPYRQNLSFQQLVRGSANARIYQCESPNSAQYPQYGLSNSGLDPKYACMQLSTTTLGAIGWYGIDDYVRAMLYGSGNIPGYTGPAANGLVQDILNNTTLSTQQEDFVARSTIPIVALIEQARDNMAANDPVGVQAEAHNIANSAAPYIEAEFTTDLALALSSAIGNLPNNQTSTIPEPQVKATEAQFNSAILADQALVSKVPSYVKAQRYDIQHLSHSKVNY
jgi:conjugative transfer pilus assembly protein TraH